MKSSPVPGKKAKNQDIRDPRDSRVSCFNSACFVTPLEDWKFHSKYAGQITQPWKLALLWNKAHWFLVENIFCLFIIITIAMLLPKWPNDIPWSTPHCGMAKIKYGERRTTKMYYSMSSYLGLIPPKTWKSVLSTTHSKRRSRKRALRPMTGELASPYLCGIIMASLMSFLGVPHNSLNL